MMPVPAGAERRYDAPGAPAAVDVVMQRAARAAARGSAALGTFGRLADRLRHFARFAVAEADPALLIAHDDKCCKAEAPAALHDLRDAIDVNELVEKLAVPVIAVFLAVPLAAFSLAIVVCLSLLRN